MFASLTGMTILKKKKNNFKSSSRKLHFTENNITKLLLCSVKIPVIIKHGRGKNIVTDTSKAKEEEREDDTECMLFLYAMR